jgi:DNA-binding transcriptional regulator WhiA
MSRAERDLVTALRDELAAVDPSRACDRLAEAAGLGPGALGRVASIARLAVRLRRVGEGNGSAPVAFDWSVAADHCRAAWLRGRFLARGSLSLAGGRTHLEFVVTPEEASQLVGHLAEFGLPASWRIRRGRGVVTSKSGDAVGTFFRRLGAAGTLLEIEARQVSRALRGELNRVLNAESANLQRAVSAAGRQLDAIAILDADGRLALQSPNTRRVADARRATPEASLADLAERLGAHRSAVQRALERLERLANDEDRRTEGRTLGARARSVSGRANARHRRPALA